MRTLLLSDRSFASREHAMLRRLEIGLVDEGCRVARAAPASAFPEPAAGLAAVADYNDSPWRFLEPSPVRRIARALDNATPLDTADDEAPIDIIHAWGETCWPLALGLARALSAPVILEVWSRRSLALVTHIERRAASLPGLWLAPDHAMTLAVERLARRWPVRTSRWGVHVPPLPPAANADTPIEALCILASGNEPHSIMNLYTALARVTTDREGPMLFMNSDAVERAPALWKHVGALGLLPRLTLVPTMESRRDLVLKTDALIVPECHGEHRSLVLEAMAAGITLISRTDRLIDAASDLALARLVDEPTDSAWAGALSWLLTNPADARALGRAARHHVSHFQLAHHQVRAALDAYAHFLSAQPIPLASPRKP
jgi:hypothetical protein